MVFPPAGLDLLLENVSQILTREAPCFSILFLHAQRQLGWLQESGIKLTTEQFQLDHFCRKSVKPRCYGRKNCPSPIIMYGILGIPLEITTFGSSSVIKKVIFHDFQILSGIKILWFCVGERGRFQSLIRAEAQIHLVCEIRQETPPHQNLYSSFSSRSVSSLPSLCSLLQQWFFLWKEMKNPSKTDLNNKDISSCIEQLLNVYFSFSVTLEAIKKIYTQRT